MIQAILLTNNEIIISQCIVNNDKDNEPHFSLMYPYLLYMDSSKLGFKLTPWLSNVVSSGNEFMIYPDKIITMKEPKKEIVEQYKKLVLFDEDTIIREDEDVEELQDIEIEIQPKVEASIKEVIVEDDENDMDEVFEEEAN